MNVNLQKSKVSIIDTDDFQLIIEIHHSGLYGKLFKDGTIKLFYILLWFHLFDYLLLFPASHNFIYLLLTKIYHVAFYCIEIQFVILILYSCFGFTRISINKENFLIKKSLWGVRREIMGKTQNIVNVEIKPIEVFHSQNKFSLFFSGQENIPYACYLLKKILSLLLE